jgi:tRNA modification GTPase
LFYRALTSGLSIRQVYEKTSDQIETMGIERALRKYREAEIVIVVIDAGDRLDEILNSLEIFKEEEQESKRIIFAINKIDTVLNPQVLIKDLRTKIKLDATYIPLSAQTGKYMAELEQTLVNLAIKEKPTETDVVVTNVRHFEALQHSHEAIVRVLEGLDSQITGDLLAMDIREVLHYLGEITGEITTDEILGNIFQEFLYRKVTGIPYGALN